MFSLIISSLLFIVTKFNEEISKKYTLVHCFSFHNSLLNESWMNLFSFCSKINFNISLYYLFVRRRFRLKYHPEDSVKRKEEQMTALKVIIMVKFEMTLPNYKIKPSIGFVV